MSKLGINTGSTPNAGDGDTLLVGAIKINENFDEIYNFLGDGVNLDVAIWDKRSTGITTTLSVGIGTTNVTSRLTVSGDGKFTGIVTATTFNGQINSGFGTISDFTNTNSNITNLTGTAATITTYFGTDLTVTNTTTTNLNAISIIGSASTITNSNNTNSNITNANITNIVGSSATISSVSSNIITTDTLTGTSCTITNLTVTNSNVNDLISSNINCSGISTLPNIINDNIFSTGIITATSFSTGATGTAINITANSITGPSTIIIDPETIGDNVGIIRIKGDLYVDGDQFIVSSSNIELADFNVGIATSVGTNLLLDGAGIGIGSTNITKTILYHFSSDSWKLSENLNLNSGKSYKIGDSEILSSDQLTITNISSIGIGTISTLNSTDLTTQNANIASLTGTSSTITSLNCSSVTTDNLVGTLSTITTLNSTDCIVSTLNSNSLNVIGVSTLSGITTVSNGTLFAQEVSISGISTFESTVTFKDNINFDDDKYINLGSPNSFRVYHASSEFAGGQSSQVRDISGSFPLILGAKEVKLTDETGLIEYSVASTGGLSVSGTVSSNQLNVSGISTYSSDVNVGVDTSVGIILSSPNGTRYRIIVMDDGTLDTIAI
jgi:hypothetical protein